MVVRRASAADAAELGGLIAAFRVALAGLRGKDVSPDLAAAAKEMEGYRRRQFPIFVAEADSGLAGYLVCRVDDKTLWAESLFVLPEHRWKGVGSALYAEAERRAAELGSETVYNWVDPDNDAVIAFLAKRGYDVLNLIELRRARRGEEPGGQVQVGRYVFRH